MKQLIIYALIFLTLGVTACTGGGAEPAVAQSNLTPTPASTNTPMVVSKESCPMTQPPNPAFVPPEPYPETDPSGGYWYGTSQLWTQLRPDGTWSGLTKSETGYGYKLALWHEGYSQKEEPRPEIILSAQQLDGQAIVEPFVHGTNAFHPDYGQFMLTSIELPSLGCWEIIAEYRDARLDFVVWVGSYETSATLTPTAYPTPYPEMPRPGSCHVTQRPKPRFVPPEPYAEWAPSGGFWYGTNELWIDLRSNGTWHGLPKSDTGYVNKIALWSESYSQTMEQQPDITLSARQLDGEAMVEPHVHGTNAFHPDYGHFMMTGIELPTLGCWEITAEYRDASLSFVVWLGP